MVELGAFVRDFGASIEVIDAKRPVALNQRSGAAFKPGIGPHSEAAALALVMAELRMSKPHLYGSYELGVAYPGLSRQKCDLCLGTAPDWEWAIEVKLLRFLGDNGQTNDNILMHILSPYPSHRSAVTDCAKLAASSLAMRKGILIFGFESPEWPLEPAVRAFESLASTTVKLGRREEARFGDLVHPVHAGGKVFGWEVCG